MKKNNKIWLFIIVCLFVLWCKEVKAENISIPTTYVNNDGCMSDKTCTLICNYANSLSDKTYTISVFYNKDNTWKIVYGEGYDLRTKKNGDFNSIFSSKVKDYVYSNISWDENNFVCPSFGYIDYSGLDSICFDNASDYKTGYCSKEANNVWHHFGTKNGSDFASASSYDAIKTTIELYYTTQYEDDITCKKNGEIDNYNDGSLLIKYLTTKLNITNENDIPQFIRNYNTKISSNETIKKYMQNAQNSAKDKCEKSAEVSVQNGTLSQTELTQAKQTNDSITIDDFIKSANTKINSLSNNVQIDTVEPTCSNIFGSTTDSNSLGYWIQKLIDIMRYVAIIILIIMSSIDFVKAITAQDADALKKAGTTFGKRLVFAIIIFFLPSLLNILLKLFGVNGLCGIK